MAVSIRSGGGTKWVERASVATPAYEQGVRSPRTDWQQATQASENAWKQGITDAASKGRFGKGVQKAGTSKWQEGAVKKGSARFAQGVQVSQGNYENGISPYLDVIKGLTLPPRGPKGSPGNLQRVAVIANALRAKKIGG